MMSPFQGHEGSLLCRSGVGIRLVGHDQLRLGLRFGLEEVFVLRLGLVLGYDWGSRHDQLPDHTYQCAPHICEYH